MSSSLHATRTFNSFAYSLFSPFFLWSARHQTTFRLAHLVLATLTFLAWSLLPILFAWPALHALADVAYWLWATMLTDVPAAAGFARDKFRQGGLVSQARSWIRASPLVVPASMPAAPAFANAICIFSCWSPGASCEMDELRKRVLRQHSELTKICDVFELLRNGRLPNALGARPHHS